MRTNTNTKTPCLVIDTMTGEGGVVAGVRNAVKIARLLVMEGLQRGALIVEAVVFVEEMAPAYAVAIEITPDGEEPKYVK